MTCRVFSGLVLSCLVISWLVLSVSYVLSLVLCLLFSCSVLSCHLLACLILSFLVLSYLFLSCPLSKTPSLELLAFVSRYACVLQAIHHKDIKQGTFRSWVDLYSLLVPCSVLSCHLLACLILSFLLLRRINALPFTPHQTQTLPQTLQGNRTLKRIYDHKKWTLKMFIKNDHLKKKHDHKKMIIKNDHKKWS